MHTFTTPNPVNLKVELWAGRIRIHAEATDTTTIALDADDSTGQELIDNAKVEQRGDDVVVVMPKGKGGLFRSRGQVEATITVPLHSNAKIETASADIDTDGPLGNTHVSTGSGEVHIEHANDAEVRTGSGDIEIGTVDGDCTVKSGSADVVVGLIAGGGSVLSGSGDVVISQIGGAFNVKTGSGDVVIKAAGDQVDAMAGSGDVMVKRIQHGKLKAKTGSGDITVGVADGTAAYLDVMTVSGEVTSSLEAADAPGDGAPAVEIVVQAGSGDVVLQRA